MEIGANIQAVWFELHPVKSCSESTDHQITDKHSTFYVTFESLLNTFHEMKRKPL